MSEATEHPKVVNVPGIPTPLQEMTLDQYMEALEPGHFARRQLDNLRRDALAAVALQTELGKLMEELAKSRAMVISLQERLIERGANDLGVHPPLSTFEKPAPPPSPKNPTKAPCPVCGIMVSALAGPWKSHLAKHEREKNKAAEQSGLALSGAKPAS